MLARHRLTLICTLASLSAAAQPQNANWYFGNAAAMSFNGGAPVGLSGSNAYTSEGGAAQSDTSGALLFYTNGAKVYNANHAQMVGPLLSGSTISTQAALIVPHPGDPDQYFIFTTDTWEFTPTELRYTIVDMSLNGGMGGLTTTVNVLVNDNVREQVAATQHSNGQDYWIVTHEANSDHFLSYRLTPLGLDTVPVISAIGMGYVGFNRWGGLRFSGACDAAQAAPQRMVSCLGSIAQATETVQLFDFNSMTGALSNVRNVADWSTVPGAYSAEFSASGNRLYVVGYNTPYVIQYDLNAVNISSTAVDVTGSVPGTKCGLLRGPDRKIYIGNPYAGTLDVIEYPDQLGMACSFVNNTVTLPSGTCGLALPNQITLCAPSIATSVSSPPRQTVPIAYPDPFMDGFIVAYPEAGRWSLRLTDALGRVVHSEEPTSSGPVERWIDASALVNGLYFLSLEGDGRHRVKRMVKAR